MKDFLKKYCPIVSKILSVPFWIVAVFVCCLKIFGDEKVDEFLVSLQVPFNSLHILYVGGIIFLLWLPCYALTAYYKETEAKNAAEAEAKAYFAENFDPGQTDTPLRVAVKDVKCRILLEKAVGTYRICYRRVGKTNELVVNGMVYDEMTATLEGEHELAAVVDGHNILVGLDNTNHSYVTFDGETVAKKIRWI